MTDIKPIINLFLFQ